MLSYKTKVRILYLIALGLIFFNSLISIFIFFGLVEYYEPYFSDFTVEDIKRWLFNNLLFDNFSIQFLWILGLILLAFTLLAYVLLRSMITLHENKNPEVKNLFVRKLFMLLPVHFGIGFLVVSFWYALFALFDVVNSTSLVGILLKFLISLLVFGPVILHNLVLLRQEGRSLWYILFK